jgi:membrane protein DedA with SNARE-associated domain
MQFTAMIVQMNWWHHLVHFYQQSDVLYTIERWMGTDWGYAVMFGLLLSCGLGVPIPEDIPLLLAGYFVAGGQMNLLIAAIAAWFGIIGGDCILYSLGRRYGMGITKLPVIGHHVSKDRIDKVHGLFEKYGVWVVAMGRLFAGIRGAMVVTAGAIRFNFIHFLIADGLAAIFSGGLFMALGYWGRKKFGDLHEIRARIDRSQHWVLAGLVIAVILFALWKWWQTKRKLSKKVELQKRAKLIEAASKHI